MILVASDVARSAASDFSHGMRITIPDGFAFAVLIPGAFDLVGSRGHTPEKSWGEARLINLDGWNGARNLLLRGGRQTAKAMTREHCASRGREQVEEVAAMHRD